jgi:hypothetical protein
MATHLHLARWYEYEEHQMSQMSQMPRGWKAESAMMKPGPGLDLAIGLAAAVSVVYDHWRVDDYTRSTEKARCDPILGWVVNEQVLHLVWQYQQTDNADDLLALARQRTIPA